jgi:hypothetical protein
VQLPSPNCEKPVASDLVLLIKSTMKHHMGREPQHLKCSSYPYRCSHIRKPRKKQGKNYSINPKNYEKNKLVLVLAMTVSGGFFCSNI